mmetsp:Transcript_11474/g.20281  ORF Transcript_11474/g.20281 Transcript_11474/m.20281 type:complete len:491 (-) Transcript_11474:130-1602(-)
MLQLSSEAKRLNLASVIASSLAQAGSRLAGSITDIRNEKETRIDATDSLGRLGSIAGDQAQHLSGQLRDEDKRLRDASAKAIRRLGPDAKVAAKSALATRENSTLHRLIEPKVPIPKEGLGFNPQNTVHDLFARTEIQRGDGGKQRRAEVNTYGSLDFSVNTRVGFRAEDRFSATNAFNGSTTFSSTRGGRSISLPPKREKPHRMRTSDQIEKSQAKGARIVAALSGGTLPERRMALRSLAAPPKGEKEEVALLVGKLRDIIGDSLWDADPSMRSLAVSALANAKGSSALRCCELLVKTLLRDDSARVRRDTAAAILKMERAAFIPHLASLAKALTEDTDAEVRRNVAKVIERAGFEAGEHIDVLVEALEDKDEVVRQRMATLLGRLGEASTRHLGNRLLDNDPSNRKSAVKALGSLGAGARKHQHRIAKLMDDDEHDVSQAAQTALRSVLPLRNGSWRQPLNPNVLQASATMQHSRRRIAALSNPDLWD